MTKQVRFYVDEYIVYGSDRKSPFSSIVHYFRMIGHKNGSADFNQLDLKSASIRGMVLHKNKLDFDITPLLS